MILVTGATGHVGAELVAQLAAQNHPVRAMTRRPHTMNAPPGVEVVYGDCDDPAGLDAAFDGADRAFLMTTQATGTAPYPTHMVALVDAARRAGMRHLVQLSVFSGGTGGDVIGAWAGQVEKAVTGSGVDWTLLRPGRFMSNALHWAPMIRRGDTVTSPFADRPTASIDPADIAAVAVAALTTDAHRGAAYQMTGAQVLTPVEELGILAETLGRPLRLVEPPLDDVRAGMLAAGTPAAVVDAIVSRTHGDDGKEVLSTVAQILGRPPATFAGWARAHAWLFSDAEIHDTETHSSKEAAR